MSSMLSLGTAVIAVLLIALLAVSKLSASAPALGLKDGKLLPCPDSPNCVNSENNPEMALSLQQYPAAQAWNALSDIIRNQGGNIIEKNESYLHAEFTSSWLRFVDDLEARLDTEHQIIHLRSASRLGHYDFGVNQNRVMAIKDKMNNFMASRVN